jgi:hypothetical protein
LTSYNIFETKVISRNFNAIQMCYFQTLMTSPCSVKRTLAEKFAVAVRLYAESAVCLATSEKSDIDFIHLSHQTIEAQSLSEAAFRAFMEHVASHQCAATTRNGTGSRNAKEQEVP